MKLRIKSRTGAAIYTVIAGRPLRNGELRCDCFAGFYNRECWHIKEAKRLVEAGVISVDPEEEIEAKAG